MSIPRTKRPVRVRRRLTTLAAALIAAAGALIVPASSSATTSPEEQPIPDLTCQLLFSFSTILGDIPKGEGHLGNCTAIPPVQDPEALELMFSNPESTSIKTYRYPVPPAPCVLFHIEGDAQMTWAKTDGSLKLSTFEFIASTETVEFAITEIKSGPLMGYTGRVDVPLEFIIRPDCRSFVAQGQLNFYPPGSPLGQLP